MKTELAEQATKNQKRNLFAELMEGVEAMKAHREGRITLRTHKINATGEGTPVSKPAK